MMQKVHKLEEEKSSLMYEILENEAKKDENEREIERLRKIIKDLQEKLSSHRGSSENSDKVWREKTAKLENEVARLQQQLKASSLTEATKDSGFLQVQLELQRKHVQQAEDEVRRLEEKLRQYENASANQQMASIPKSELIQVRAQLATLPEKDKQIATLEAAEKHLRETIAKLREGKDACGHEQEISQLKEKAEKYNTLVQAHELLKANHEDLKRDLQIQKNGSFAAGDRLTSSSSKSVQARLGASYTLKQITPELRHALKNLGARFPEAYDDFVRTLDPATSTAKMHSAHHDGVHKEAVAQQQRYSDQFAQQRAGQSAKAPPGGDEVKTEATLWHEIEARGPGHAGTSDEDTYWARLERSSGDLDDVTLCMTFKDEDDDESASNKGAHSRSSSEGSIPPLPMSLPPPAIFRSSESPGSEYFYLPSDHHADEISIDDASEIAEDDDVIPPLRSVSRGSTPNRARSLDRDWDTSDAGTRRRGGKSGRLTGSLDSIPDSGLDTLHQSDLEVLQERVSQLERQVKAKEKQLAIAHLNQKEMEKRVKDSDEVFTLKSKLQDHTRQLETEKRFVKDSEEQLERMKSQLRNKDHEIREMRSEMERLHESLLQQHPESSKLKPELESQTTFLKHQLEIKDKELTAKHNENDTLNNELRKWQEESQMAKQERHIAEEEKNQIQLELEALREHDQKYSDLHRSHASLQKKHEELVNEHHQLTQTEQEKTTLQKIVLKLRGQLRDLERIELERQVLEDKLKALQKELKQTKKNESDLTKDNARLLHQLDGIKKENSLYRNMERDYHKVRAKFDEMERIKTKAQTMVAPLRARVIRLSQKCRNKDDFINRLVAALRRHGEAQHLVDEADKIQSHNAAEEYNRPLSPLNASVPDKTTEKVAPSGEHPSPLRLQAPTHELYHSSNSSTDDLLNSSLEMDNLQALLDPDLLNGVGPPLDIPYGGTVPRRRPKQAGQKMKRPLSDGVLTLHRPPVTIDDLVYRPPELSYPPVVRLENGSHEVNNNMPNNGNIKQNGVIVPDTDQFKAVKDYEPELFSQSGHKRLELALKEGEVVTVLGAVDGQGYYEAELNGKIGLVPSSYLQPVYPKRHSGVPEDRKEQRHTQSHSHKDSSPEQILHMHNRLQQSHVPDHNVPPTNTSVITPEKPVTQPSTITRVPYDTLTHPAFITPKARPPAAARSPRNRTSHPAVQRAPFLPPTGHPMQHGQSHQPQMHQQSTSQQLMSVPMTTGAHIAPPTDHSQSVRRAQPVEGPPEPPREFHIQRILGTHSVLLSWTAPRMDELARSNGVIVKGYRIYINNRDRQVLTSPHMTKALVEKLDLYRPQHFSVQTVAETGQLSRMVDCVFEDVLGTGPGDNADRESAGDGDVSSLMSSVQQDEGERRVFVAVYDYHPPEQSPNEFPDHELAFKTGDIVTTYGSVQPNGFYHAKIHGQKGLVPASFIEQVALLRSQSKRSLSGSSVVSARHRPSPGSSHLVSGERPLRGQPLQVALDTLPSAQV